MFLLSLCQILNNARARGEDDKQLAQRAERKSKSKRAVAQKKAPARKGRKPAIQSSEEEESEDEESDGA